MKASIESRQKFLNERLDYYANFSASVANTIHSGWNFARTTETLGERQVVVDTLGNKPWEICIVTATRDRLDFLKQAHTQLDKQHGDINWRWLIVDNSTNDLTSQFFDTLGDDRVLHMPYPSEAGCAYPVRNYGLGLVAEGAHHLAKGNRMVMVIDSDDQLFDEFSLSEISKSAHDEDALVHGFAVCEYIDDAGEIAYGSHPHDLDSSFPQINALSEVFDKGLNILSGAFPVELLKFLDYPAERSFEDNGFNHKLMLYAKKHAQRVRVTPYPITTKRFHKDTMAKENDMIGDSSKNATIGEHIVSGIRADIVSNLAHLTDYFVREGL